jgi:hypothetical protein
MGQNSEENKQNSLIEQHHQPSMGQSGTKIKENCPIESSMGQNNEENKQNSLIEQRKPAAYEIK